MHLIVILFYLAFVLSSYSYNSNACKKWSGLLQSRGHRIGSIGNDTTRLIPPELKWSRPFELPSTIRGLPGLLCLKAFLNVMQ
jgi:hypothetical protein